MKQPFLLTVFVLFSLATPKLLRGQQEIDFSRDVLPILADHCFTCHGPDEATREGGFRLDRKDSALAEADSGAIPVVPGDPEASELLQRVFSDDESWQMPPPDQKKQPSPEQLAVLRAWIEQGAKWEEHWAFQTPLQPDLPKVADQAWPRNAIDHFVLARLESAGMVPAPEASKTTLVRRLFLDLTGLPPSPEEVRSFVEDPASDAYENLVDRLLQSPRYGEHMATFWLDAARFADTNGYQNDFRRSMWLWRDWVIRAYNDNMPFDQFTIEQLAGDMLPDASQEQKIASGFNRNHRSNTEGGSINEEWLVENVVDRVETTSTVFLGLTMGCARCHDHKYDPISQREFYQFFSYFHNIDEQGVYTEKRGNAGPMVTVVTDEYRERLERLQQELGELHARLDQTRAQLNDQLPQIQSRLEEQLQEQDDSEPSDVPAISLLSPIVDDHPAAAVNALQAAGNDFRIDDDLTGPACSLPGKEGAPHPDRLDLGPLFDFDAAKGFSVSAWVFPTSYGAIVSRMDASAAYRGFDMLLMPDGRMNVHLIHNWPGNATKITTTLSVPRNTWTHVVVTAKSPGKAADITVYFNGQPVAQTVDADTLNGSTLTDHPVWLGLRSQTPAYQGKISDVRFWDLAVPDTKVEKLFLVSMAEILKRTGQHRSVQEQEFIQAIFLNRESRPLLDQIEKKKRELDSVNNQLPTTMVMKELDTPRATYVLKRGVYDQPDKSRPVTAAVPALFGSSESPANRLELANWIVSEDNPLTARVQVNHFWARYFGIGLLETAENFGVQSPPPSHPLLLDWLAREFVSSGWDVKQMQRLIVTSATYRQSSAADSDSWTKDPRNRLLGRGARFRLPAETIRDNALAISGLLVERIGGPSVKPYQPAGLWEELAGGAGEPPYEQATDDNLYRRSLYIYRKRTVPHPAMTTFDGVGRDVCAVSRDRTNTPMQALALLNDVTYVEAARQFATRVIRSRDSQSDRVRYAFQCATGRAPVDAEQQVLESGLAKYLTHFNADETAATELVSVGQSDVDPDINVAELAAWTSVCSVILNLDEVITKE